MENILEEKKFIFTILHEIISKILIDLQDKKTILIYFILIEGHYKTHKFI